MCLTKSAVTVTMTVTMMRENSIQKLSLRHCLVLHSKKKGIEGAGCPNTFGLVKYQDVLFWTFKVSS